MKFEVSFLPIDEEDNEYATPCYFYFKSYYDVSLFVKQAMSASNKISCNISVIEGDDLEIPLSIEDEFKEVITDLCEGSRISISNSSSSGYDISKELNDFLVKIILEATKNG